jgi:anti-sigma-K factor RskA
LDGTEGADGSIKVAWSDSLDSAVLMGDDLPAAPDGQAYELWLIDANGPIAMSVLDDANDGQVRAVIDMDAAPQAWGITIEPEGGSDTPTGDVMFLADV